MVVTIGFLKRSRFSFSTQPITEEMSAEAMAERARDRAADLAESLQERAQALALTAEAREAKLQQREEELNSSWVGVGMAIGGWEVDFWGNLNHRCSFCVYPLANKHSY